MFGDDQRREPIGTLALRAVQCALVIQTEYDKYDSNQGFTLTLHVGTFRLVVSARVSP